ncbi:MAG: hypothetical protein RIM84_21060 [Alphaproteobacteria bacterium]
MTHARHRRAAYERDFRFKVDVPSPPDGLGQRLNAMLRWCEANAGDWANFGSKFYFAGEADAVGFRREFGGENIA